MYEGGLPTCSCELIDGDIQDSEDEDEVVFHLQYGKFAQMPELDLPYASSRYMHLVWGGQNYTPDPMGFDLDPVLTTQYEVGMSYQFLPDAAIDVTAFAKNTTGQVVLNLSLIHI